MIEVNETPTALRAKEEYKKVSEADTEAQLLLANLDTQETSNRIPTVNVVEGFKIKAKNIVDAISSVKEEELPIMEVFYSLEGEGSFIGQPRVLARIGGCLIGCRGCDTPHSWGLKNSQILSIDELVDTIVRVAAGKTKVVAITGGEPAHYPKQVIALSKRLKSLGYWTWLETSGVTGNTFDLFQSVDFVSLDIKTPSSQVTLSQEALSFLKNTHVWRPSKHHTKAVITDMDDLLWIEREFPTLLNNYSNPLILTPAGGPKFSVEKMSTIVDMILGWNKGYSIRVIAQQHVLLKFR